MKWRRLCLVFAVVACLPFSNLCRAAEDVLSIVPDRALAVVVVNQIGKTREKLVSLANQLQVPGAGMLSAGPFSLAAHPHIDKAGDVAMAMLPFNEAGQPVFLWFVPTTNYEALLDQFAAKKSQGKLAKVTIAGKEFVAAQKNGYAMLTTEGNRKQLRAALGAAGDMAGATAQLGDWRSEQDAYAIAMPAGIKLAQQQVLAGLTIAKTRVAQAGEQAQTALAGLEMYEALFRAMDREISHFALGLQLKSDGGVQLVSRSLLVKDGVVAKLAKQIKPAVGNLLAGLPQGEFVIAGGGTLPETWSDELLSFSFKMLKSYPGGEDLTEQDLEKLADISAQSMKGMRSMAMLFGVGDPGQPLYSNFLIAIQVDDAEEYMKNYEKAMGQMIEHGKQTNNPLLNSYAIERLTIDGRSALKLTMDMDVFLGSGQPPEAKKVLQAMFGNAGKLDVFLTAANPTTVVGAYISQQQLSRAVKAAKKAEPQFSGDAHVKSTAALLPGDAQWVGFLSPRGTIQFFGRMLATILPDAAPSMPDFPQTSPIGFAAKLSPEGLETVMAMPGDTIKAAADMIPRDGVPQE